ncbi:MAG: GMC family oxidoreductase, partial [Salaquimonas sp.]
MTTHYDVIIVGAGIAGAIMAKELGKAGKKVLILESGPRERTDRVSLHEKYLTSPGKLPNTPYAPYEMTPDIQAAPRAMTSMTFKWPGLTEFNSLQTDAKKRTKFFKDFNTQSYLTYDETTQFPFLSTYERLAGGTTWHWLATSVRLVPNDFKMKSTYNVAEDWPIDIDDIFDDYALAESEIGVSADISDQTALEPYLGKQFPANYQYPMGRIPMSISDSTLGADMKGLMFDNQPIEMTCTPQGRNSEYRDNRPACQGNSSCIPICPIQAKYDATTTLQSAEQYAGVTTITEAVAYDMEVGPNQLINSVSYYKYVEGKGKITKTSHKVSGKIVILAAHAVETAKLLLMSNGRKGIANSSDQVGRNLMDHLCYLGWGLSNTQGFPYRGPRSGSGVESLRDGTFRNTRSAWRIDVGNVGWEWPDDDPVTTTKDFINGTNNSQLNDKNEQLFGMDLINRLNDFNTRMVRLCYLVEQEPQASNRITLSDTYTDGLGLPRPELHYSIRNSEYTQRGIVSAIEATDLIFKKIGKNYTRFQDLLGFPAVEFTLDKKDYKANLFGAGHILGTYRMGSAASNSVVNADSRSWD